MIVAEILVVLGVSIFIGGFAYQVYHLNGQKFKPELVDQLLLYGTLIFVLGLVLWLLL